MTKKARRTSDTVVCYLRVSTDEQADSGAGLSAQRTALERECEAKGWHNVLWLTDAGYSAKTLNRPALQEALAMLASGEAGVLAVAKLDRLSRSVADFANLTQQATREGWAVRALDLGLDQSTAQGSMMAGILSVFAEFERNLISDRTRSALAARRAAGVVLGRPRVLSDEVRATVRALRNEGLTFAALADRLNADNVPTARGRGVWYPSSVRAVYQSAA